MRKFWYFCLGVVLTYTTLTLFIEPEIVTIVNTSKIDSLQTIVNNLNLSIDSLKSIKDSVQIKIIKVNEQYKTQYSTVCKQSINDDIMFFTNYLSKTNKGQFDSDNSNTIETN